ncbi:zf-HC2 domain-containing protein [Brevibacillus humidisoli]|uniref:zf-HC2 domain-containing protein n=1 Tax=Brevibacillus humidisoli TaxID=2895522 RepID=UPI001E3EB71B|nr:zf-HC2 domain-containing protein [Brevibacillus humidisoli]UFJ42764.1 zf-HC2 domain-containing protein [Brevibacillus humidisoli]
MKCEEAQQLLTEYTDNLLPEITRRRLDQHLETCLSCRTEHDLWKDSGKWIQAEKEKYANVHSPKKSIVDAVMERILSEEKWAIPIGRKVFTVTARMRRLGALAAMVLLALCSFALYTHSGEEKLMAGTIVTPTKTEVISASIEITTDQGESATATVPPDSSQVASAAGGIGYDLNQEQAGTKPNYGLIFGFFGILVTVLAMSWLTRA